MERYEDTPGGRLYCALMAMHMQQGELCRMTQIKDGQISKWINNRRVPTFTELVEVANALKVSADYLCGFPVRDDIECGKCGTRIRFCPTCGEPLKI